MNLMIMMKMVIMPVIISIIIKFYYLWTNSSDFEAIAAYCSKYTSSLPIVLLLGFFTSTSMQVRSANFKKEFHFCGSSTMAFIRLHCDTCSDGFLSLIPCLERQKLLPYSFWLLRRTLQK